MKRLLFILPTIFLSQILLAKTIIVGAKENVKTIQQAISIAKNGDTILVKYGIYKEGSINISKSITLLGLNYPVLDGESKYENIVITGKNITVKGFLIKDSKHSSSNDYAAVSIANTTMIIIENNKIVNAHFGVHLANSTYCSILRNEITGFAASEQSAGNGIHIWKSDHALIDGNQIKGHRDGIYFEFVTDSEIKNNTSENNIRYGLHFMFSHNDNYFHNTFRNNGTGVAVMYTHNVKMEGNRFENNWGSSSFALLLKDISDSYMINNTFSGNTIAIFMEGSNRMNIKKNSFKNNGWAIKIQANCSDNFINNNNFESNTFDIATNGTMVLSNFDNNYWDRYEGYDRNHDGFGDIPYHPVSMYSMIVEKNSNSLILLRSFMVSLLDRAEKAIPSLTPENLVDKKPMIKPNKL